MSSSGLCFAPIKSLIIGSVNGGCERKGEKAGEVEREGAAGHGSSDTQREAGWELPFTIVLHRKCFQSTFSFFKNLFVCSTNRLDLTRQAFCAKQPKDWIPKFFHSLSIFHNNQVMTSPRVSTISPHALTQTPQEHEKYQNWVLLFLQNLNIDLVTYNHTESEQNWNKQASLWCVSVCVSRGLGGTWVLTRTKAYKTKGCGLVSQPRRPTQREKHTRNE